MTKITNADYIHYPYPRPPWSLAVNTARARNTGVIFDTDIVCTEL